jgi:hypothetical protein
METAQTLVAPTEAPAVPTPRVQFIKADSPKRFTGKKNEDVQDWVFSCEQYFLAAVFGGPFPAELKVPTAANRLDGTARMWWRDLVKGVDETQVTWEQFKALLSARFQSQNKEKNARDALARLKQAGKYIKFEDYLERFQEVSQDLSQMSEFERNHSFVSGLKPRTQELIHATGNPYHMDFDDLTAQAERIDTASMLVWQSKQSNSNNNNYYKHSNFRQDGFTPHTPKYRDDAVPMELGNLRFGTYEPEPEEELSAINTAPIKNKKLSAGEVEKYKREGRCFKCNKIGHIAKKCPQQVPDFPRRQ